MIYHKLTGTLFLVRESVWSDVTPTALTTCKVVTHPPAGSLEGGFLGRSILAGEWDRAEYLPASSLSLACFFEDLFLFLIYMYVFHVNVCHEWVPVYGGQKSTEKPLELELQAIVTCPHVEPGD